MKRKKRKNKKNNNVKKYIKTVLYEVAVIGTMSSGKSTLINAMLGEDLLPSENQACTAKIYKIIDDDYLNNFEIEVYQEGLGLKKIKKDELKEVNKDRKVSEIIIKGDFIGINNVREGNNIHQICLVDTPGPNNSLDKTHAEIAYELIGEKSTSHILYVLNATQIGVNDDKSLLIDILNHKKSIAKQLEIIFILNKADNFDSEKESLVDNKKEIEEYLKEIGFKEPKVISISAYAAKLFKFALKEKLTTKKENIDFEFYYDFFNYNKISESKHTKEIEARIVQVNGKNYKAEDIVSRLYATGVMDIEKQLSNFLNNRVLSELDTNNTENTDAKQKREVFKKP